MAVGVLLLAVVVGVILLHAFPPARDYLSNRGSVCTMKNVTGIPCLACRGTRAALCLSQGQIGRAFWFNPLLSLVGLGLLGIMISVVSTGWWPELECKGPGQKLAIVVFVAVLLGNWIYVIAAGG